MARDFDVKVKLNGLDDLKARLQAASYETQYKGGRFALRKAAQLLADAAKANSLRLDDPKTARSIASNIAVRWNARVYKSTGDLAFRIGVLGGARFSGKGRPALDADAAPTPEWRALEFGTETTAAKPFFRPAVIGNLQAATNVFISQYTAAIDRAIKRAAKAPG